MLLSRGLLAGGAVLAVLAIIAAPAMATDRPNLILINTDDQTLAQLRPDVMPNVTTILGEHGTEFTEALTQPLCCPSRAGMLTGQYPHNNGVFNNRQGYRALVDKENTLPVWLQRAGYRTALVGKFLNQYPKAKGLEPAPGFSSWFDLLGTSYYGARFSDDGKQVTLGDSGGRNHVDNVMTRHANGFIRRTARQERPFFLWLSYLAPHGAGGPHPAECATGLPVPTPGDLDTFADEPLPEPPSFDEPNVSDKPSFIQDLDPIDSVTIAGFTQWWRCALGSLAAVDRGVKKIRKELRATGEGANTVMIFTSDNGRFFGEHRMRRSKVFPYGEAERVPLLVRGPQRLIGDGAEGREVDLPVTNIDLAPTFLKLARARPCASPGDCRKLDGRSLLPLLRGNGDSWPEDRGTLLELDHVSRQPGNPCTFKSIRTPSYAYTEYPLVRDPETGECVRGSEAELYDLGDDPFELRNLLVTDPNGSEATREALEARLHALRRCDGRECE